MGAGIKVPFLSFLTFLSQSGSKKIHHLHPGVSAVFPEHHRVVRLAVPERVVGQSVNVDLGRNVHRAEFVVHFDRTHGRVAVAVAVEDAHRRGFFVKCEVRDEIGVISAARVGSVCAVLKNVRRVNRDREIHVARHFVQFIDRFVRGGLARRGRHERQMTTG